MDIKKITKHKKRFLPLLLLADEQEDMIHRYLERGELFALYDPDLRAVCVVTQEQPGLYELKNLAVMPEHRRQRYGKQMVAFICGLYPGSTLLVGTGDSPLTIPFYKACGFVESHRVPHFFSEHYDHPIYECGVLLDDMVYLKKEL